MAFPLLLCGLVNFGRVVDWVLSLTSLYLRASKHRDSVFRVVLLTMKVSFEKILYRQQSLFPIDTQ